ncbi:DEAD/DEAH box helicase [Portibacter lacus]|uniref:RNA helicase n=1 Tax=Portibacter lacus TaxID=1099794 RepID=A0AA37SQC9_9BACT|nr:DEAD/DEAH box helicase [Portibacter lacus]GLR17764.1 RNA helicase [Portibacter lacus]
MKFTELGLADEIIESIGYMGFEEATPIQELSIPIIMNGDDIIACAQTGTGKTAAFILPTLHKLFTNPKSEVTRALVICPTRELAIQIDKQIQGFTYFLGLHSIAIYGGGSGNDWVQEKEALSQGADIIVSTPGKLISHLNMGYVDFSQVEFFIMDEADRMLDMGFKEDIDKIASFLPASRQTLMFSATMPTKIRELAKKTLKDPKQVNIAISKPAAGVLQAVYLAHENQKLGLITRLIRDKPNYKRIIVFTSRKKKVTEIVRALKSEKFNVEGVSSDYEQSEREAVIANFKSLRTRIVVATDVLSRGIDIKDINLVINYDTPSNAEDYVHRVGRTARADTTGVAITFVNEDDMQDFNEIEQLIDMEIMKLPPFPELGPGPTWNPNARKKKRSFGGGKNKKHSGKKTWKKKK